MSSQFTYSSQHERSPEDPTDKTYKNAQYHYVLASMVLASWKLMGITIVIKEKWGVQLNRNAQSTLIAVVVLCGYRMVIEWLQCGPERNKLATIDYWIHHMIAIGAIVISLVPLAVYE